MVDVERRRLRSLRSADDFHRAAGYRRRKFPSTFTPTFAKTSSRLYGFSTRRERAIFEKLMTISGIGPKLAVTILSGGSVEDLVGAIKRRRSGAADGDSGRRKERRRERIILELKDKLQDFAEAPAKSTRRNGCAVGAGESWLQPRACRERQCAAPSDGERDPRL